jgi:hypothetical protein
MNKLLLAISVLGAGVVTFGALHQATLRAEAARSSHEIELKAVNSHLVQLDETTIAMREELAAQKQRLREASSRRTDATESSKRLNQKMSGMTATQLREELGLGWNSSPDYVLVRKDVLKKINLGPLDYTARVTEVARGILAISKEERSQIATAVQQATAEVLPLARRIEPAGDLVAQYLILPEDPMLVQSISNNFAANITTILGNERSDLFLHHGWAQLKSTLPLVGSEPTTMSIRRSGADGEEKFSCEVKQGTTSSVMDVRYTHVPARWFSLLFPGGWREVAAREGFELPKDFEKRQ